MIRNTNEKISQRVDVQVSIFTAAVAILVCLVTSVLYYRITYNDMLRSMEDRVYSIQSFIQSHIDKSTFTKIESADDIETDLYKQAHSVFRSAQEVMGVMYLYSGKRTAEGDLIYVIDCIDPAADDFRAPGDSIEEEIIPEMELALSGQVVMPKEIKNTEWGKIFIAYLPVHVGNEIVGVIGVEFEAEHQFDTFHSLFLISPVLTLVLCVLCSLLAKRLFRRISNPLYKDMYNTDYLTNLKNRNAFEIDLKNLSARNNFTGIGFYVVDLNNLKKVNDTLGHEAGDIYIKTAARSFQEEAGKNAAVYRIGGDEFVLISTQDSPKAMAQLEAGVISRFQELRPDWGMDLSFSIGCALYDPAMDANLFAAYKRADKLMYERKQEFHAQQP